MAVTCEKQKSGEYRVTKDGRVKAKHMDQGKAERFATSLGWKKPKKAAKKGSAEPKKKDVKAAKKPVKKAKKGK